MLRSCWRSPVSCFPAECAIASASSFGKINGGLERDTAAMATSTICLEQIQHPLPPVYGRNYGVDCAQSKPMAKSLPTLTVSRNKKVVIHAAAASVISDSMPLSSAIAFISEIRRIHPALFGPPLVQGGPAHPVLAAQPDGRHLGLNLARPPHDPGFREAVPSSSEIPRSSCPENATSASPKIGGIATASRNSDLKHIQPDRRLSPSTSWAETNPARSRSFGTKLENTAGSHDPAVSQTSPSLSVWPGRGSYFTARAGLTTRACRPCQRQPDGTIRRKTWPAGAARRLDRHHEHQHLRMPCPRE